MKQICTDMIKKFIVGVVFCFISAPIIAEEVPVVGHLEACLSLAQNVPEKAKKTIQRWRSRGWIAYAGACEGIVLFNEGNFLASAELLEAAVPYLDLDTKKMIRLYNSTCWAWLRAHFPQKAVQACTKALNLDPYDVELRIDRAFTYVEQKLYERALSDLNVAVQQAPNHAQVYVYRAAVYQRLGRLQESLSDVNRALVLRPEDPNILFQRGEILENLGKLPQAYKDWRKIISLVPNSELALKAQNKMN